MLVTPVRSPLPVDVGVVDQGHMVHMIMFLIGFLFLIWGLELWSKAVAQVSWPSILLPSLDLRFGSKERLKSSTHSLHSTKRKVARGAPELATAVHMPRGRKLPCLWGLVFYHKISACFSVFDVRTRVKEPKVSSLEEI